MKKPRPPLPTAAELRQRAEERLRAAPTTDAVNEDATRQLHELQVHQIELELQNEELLQSRAALEASAAKYADLYDFAPVSYLTLDLAGKIHEANLTACTYLGVDRAKLLGQSFPRFLAAISSAPFRAFLEKTATADSKETCEVTLPKKDGPPRRARLEGLAFGEGGHCRVVLIDITEQTREAAENRHLLEDAEHTRLSLLDTVEDLTLSEAAVRAREADMIEAQRIGHFGSWESELIDREHREANPLRWSAEVYRIFGIEPSAFGASYAAFLAAVHPADRERTEAANRRAVSGEENLDLEHRIVRPDGTIRWVHELGELKRDDAGRVTRLAGTVLDITERKLAEEILRHSESEQRRLAAQLSTERERLLEAQRVAKLGSWETDLVTFAVTWSSETHRIFETDAESFQPTHQRFLDRVHPQDREAVEEAFVGSVERPGPFVIEHRVLFPDGRIKYVEERWQIVRDAENQPLRAIGIAHDITESHAAAEALRASEAEFRTLAESMPQIVWITGADGKTTYFNHHWMEFTGLTLEESLGDGWSQPFHPEDRPRSELAWSRAVAQVSEYALEARLRGQDGSYRWFLIRGEPLRNAEGGVLRWFGTSTDIHDLKGAELEVSRTNRALQMISRCNELFIRIDDEMTLLEEVCRVTVETGGYRLAWVGYPQQDATSSVKKMAHHGAGAGYLDELVVSWDEKQHGGQGPGGIALRTGEPFILNDLASDPNFLYLEPAIRFGLHGVIVLPLKDKGTVLGMLVLYSGAQRELPEAEIQLLRELADDIGFGVSNLRARSERQRLQKAVEMVAGAVSTTAGAEFFEQLTIHMAEALPAPAAFVARLLPGEPEMARTLAGSVDGAPAEAFDFLLRDSPCGRGEEECCVLGQVSAEFPNISEFAEIGAQAFVGRWLINSAGQTLGVIFVLFRAPLQDPSFVNSTLRIFAARAASEMERQQSDARLREQAALLDAAHEAIYLKDLHDGIRYWNAGAERLLGWTVAEVADHKISDLLYTDAEKARIAKEKVRADGVWEGELETKTKAGKILALEVSWTLVRNAAGEPDAILAINTDITERKHLEQQFLRAQRMESIGTLAGGIAHDLNNSLAPILTSLELLKMKLSDPDSRELISILETSAQRGADMVRQVLTFARGVEGKRMEVQVKHLLRDVEKIVRDTFLRNIAVRVIVPDDLWTVPGDPTQLHQVLVNLCVNARDAMPDGGELTISAENRQIDAQYAGMNLSAQPGRYVFLQIEDSGTGMPQEVVEKVFDPFFTTKELGKGTGLGLSTSLAIVKSHGGFIQVYSEVAKGTKFKVYLPAESEPSGIAPQPTSRDLPRGHDELILVVDDESSVREVTKQTLEAFGYRVILANDGADAVAIYASRSAEIAVILTDMMMPNMDGPAAIRVLKSMNPAIRIIAASGLSSNGHVAKAANLGIKHFLPKPYTAETLLTTLRKILAE